MKMTPSEIRAGLRRAADQLGIDSPEGRVVCKALEKLDAGLQHAGASLFVGEVPGVTEAQMDRLGYYVARRELHHMKVKASKQAKSFNEINVTRDAEGKHAADRDMLRAHRDAGGNMQIKALQKIRGLHGKGKRYLIERRKEI